MFIDIPKPAVILHLERGKVIAFYSQGFNMWLIWLSDTYVKTILRTEVRNDYGELV